MLWINFHLITDTSQLFFITRCQHSSQYSFLPAQFCTYIRNSYTDIIHHSTIPVSSWLSLITTSISGLYQSWLPSMSCVSLEGVLGW